MRIFFTLATLAVLFQVTAPKAGADEIGVGTLDDKFGCIELFQPKNRNVRCFDLEGHVTQSQKPDDVAKCQEQEEIVLVVHDLLVRPENRYSGEPTTTYPKGRLRVVLRGAPAAVDASGSEYAVASNTFSIYLHGSLRSQAAGRVVEAEKDLLERLLKTHTLCHQTKPHLQPAPPVQSSHAIESESKYKNVPDTDVNGAIPSIERATSTTTKPAK